MPKVSPPYEPVRLAMHVVLVVVGVAAALMIVYSPNPVVGMVVLALVLGVELPITIRGWFAPPASSDDDDDDPTPP